MCARRLCNLIGIALLAFCGELAGQEPAVLKPSSKVVLSGNFEAMIIDPARCDQEGNIYLKGVESAPVTEISPEGREIARFSLDSVPDPEVKRGSFYAFALNPRGGVFELVHTERQTFIVSFDSDGEYEGTVKLNAPGVYPYRIAAFPTGEFLLVGSVQGEGGAAAGVSADTAIFDARGDLVKTLSLVQDPAENPSTSPANPKAKGKIGERDVETERIIGSGDVFVGPDGNAYLVRNSKSPVVYVVTSQGTVVRRVILRAPAEGLWPTGAPLIAPGKIIIPFGKGNSGRTLRYTELYSVYDAQSGDHLLDYAPAPELRGGLLCYAHNAFVFLGVQDRQMALIFATAR